MVAYASNNVVHFFCSGGSCVVDPRAPLVAASPILCQSLHTSICHYICHGVVLRSAQDQIWQNVGAHRASDSAQGCVNVLNIL
jgi:hypothetical protein